MIASGYLYNKEDNGGTRDGEKNVMRQQISIS